MNRCSVAVLSLLMCACAATPPYRADVPDDPELAAAIDREAEPEAIAVCHGYGCLKSEFLSIDRDAWREIAGLFQPGAPGADEERNRVARAVAIFERSMGRQVGTDGDKPRTPFSLGDPTQLDCVDESINTSSFLHLLERKKLLRWHRVGEPAQRYAVWFFGIHFTAVLVDRQTGVAWAVDSWFHENGMPAEVVELDRWKSGWEPE